jgi:hypothetical protein
LRVDEDEKRGVDDLKARKLDWAKPRANICVCWGGGACFENLKRGQVGCDFPIHKYNVCICCSTRCSTRG